MKQLVVDVSPPAISYYNKRITCWVNKPFWVFLKILTWSAILKMVHNAPHGAQMPLFSYPVVHKCRVVRNLQSRQCLNHSRWPWLTASFLTFGYERKLTTQWRGVWGSSPRKLNLVKICLHVVVILPYSCQYFINFACLLCMDKYFFDLTKK